MRFLDRGRAPCPSCLESYAHGRDDWSKLAKNSADYRAIRSALEIFQSFRCAYCDCDLAREGPAPHIEHFYQRSRLPQYTFQWENMFLSCTHSERCGKHKDQSAGIYEDRDVVKPDQEDPRRLLFFGSDGWVRPREGLGERDTHRARETIRVFALDCPGLRGTRRSYLSAVLAELESAQSAGFSETELSAYMHEIAKDYAEHPFSSAVLDLLGL